MSRVTSLARSRVALWAAGWVGLYIGFAIAGFIRLAADERSETT
ncbi:MAG: hypothetical protein PGN29_06060 [Gordonia paraffinivorans]